MKPHVFIKNQTGIVKVLFGTIAVVLIMLCYAVWHYSKINDSEDPRVTQARQLLRKYEKGLESDQYGEAMSILNAMETIYLKTPGYEKSYEIGVILNNKASIYLVKLETRLLTGEKIDRNEIIDELSPALRYTKEAIQIYENWLSVMGTLSPEEIDEKIRPTFYSDDPALKEVNIDDVIEKRVNDLILAQVETKKRLSVTYANLGVIDRYRGELLEAKKNYKKAIALWDRNYTAKNNLNVLMNKPVVKPSIVDRLFPPERTKDIPGDVKSL